MTPTRYEPSLLLEMTSRQSVGSRKAKTIVRTATVLKDRSDVLEGLQFDDPTFENFLPHIEQLNLGGAHSGFDDTRSSEQLFPSDPGGRDNQAVRRKIVLGDIHDLLVVNIPGLGAADKQRKIQLLRKCFDAGWTEMEEVMPLEQLRRGLERLRHELEGEADPSDILVCCQSFWPHELNGGLLPLAPKARCLDFSLSVRVAQIYQRDTPRAQSAL